MYANIRELAIFIFKFVVNFRAAKKLARAITQEQICPRHMRHCGVIIFYLLPTSSQVTIQKIKNYVRFFSIPTPGLVICFPDANSLLIKLVYYCRSKLSIFSRAESLCARVPTKCFETFWKKKNVSQSRIRGIKLLFPFIYILTSFLELWSVFFYNAAELAELICCIREYFQCSKRFLAGTEAKFIAILLWIFTDYLNET